LILKAQASRHVPTKKSTLIILLEINCLIAFNWHLQLDFAQELFCYLSVEKTVCSKGSYALTAEVIYNVRVASITENVTPPLNTDLWIGENWATFLMVGFWISIYSNKKLISMISFGIENFYQLFAFWQWCCLGLAILFWKILTILKLSFSPYCLIFLKPFYIQILMPILCSMGILDVHKTLK